MSEPLRRKARGTRFLQPGDDVAPKSHLPTLTTLPSRLDGALASEGLLLAKRYRLEALLGTGGMGQVFRAQHIALGTSVAVKIMHSGVAAIEENVRRFKREAQATSSLHHRNIVRVLDHGEADGLVFIVMELLSGRTLADELDELSAPPELAFVAEVMDAILCALEAAHGAGIVHRDLKPENVFLAKESDGARIVKVVDFGLAKVETQAGETLTRADAVAGTPLYMSPEQCRSLSVGPAADLYAVGCILTELLQLDPLFPYTTAMEVMTKQMFMPPPALQRPANAEPVPELLNRLRLDLLAKSADARPESAANARARLRDALDPARHASLLPTRAGQAHIRRDSRIPPWQHAALPSAAAETPTATARVVRLTADPSGVTPELVLGLHAGGFSIAEHETSSAVCLLDVGDDVRAAESWLATHRASGDGAPVVVCAHASGSEALRRLIAAGAADIATYPLSLERLQRCLERVVRRRR